MAILMSSAFSLGLPPVLPLARAASRPALVRSEILLCSNSASIAMSWKNSMPVGVLVLTSSVSDTKLMFRFFSRSSVSMSCCNDRPSRSSFHTTRVSPSFRYSMAARNALRSKRIPVCLSVKTLTTPRFFKASNWMEGEVLFRFRDTCVADFLCHRVLLLRMCSPLVMSKRSRKRWNERVEKTEQMFSVFSLSIQLLARSKKWTFVKTG